MPLVIADEVLSELPESVPHLIQKYPEFKQSSVALHADVVPRVVEPQGLLYVSQREMAAVAPADLVVKLMGTDNATTCHIVILRHTDSGATCLAHFDGSGTSEAVLHMISLVKQLSPDKKRGRLELHVAGGFLDDRFLSAELSQEILDEFHCQSELVHLKTACITDLNDIVKEGIHYPQIYGLAIDVMTGDIFNATFTDEGPDIPLRSARVYSGSHRVLNIYDNVSHHLSLGPFTYRPMRDAELWCQAPDSLIRKYMSTSPEQEKVGFEDDVRATMAQLRDHPDPMKTMFPGGKARRYKKLEDGQWIRAAD